MVQQPLWSTEVSQSSATGLRYEFELHAGSSTGNSQEALDRCGPVSDAGPSASCVFDRELEDGGAFKVRARAVDAQTVTGPWSDWTEFAVDATPYVEMNDVAVEGTTAAFEVTPNDPGGSSVRGRVVVTANDGTSRTATTPMGGSGETVTLKVDDLAFGEYSFEVFAESSSRSSRTPVSGDFEVLDPEVVLEPTPGSCVEFAVENVDGEWSCIGDTVYTEDANGGEVETVVDVDEDEEFSTMARIDSYHASKYTTWFYGISGRVSGSVRFRMHVALHWHSANVWQTAEATSKVRLTWRLRIRHDRTGKPDNTLFTYPKVQGCSSAKYTCHYDEKRGGDGYNRLPYQTRWKVFWEAYNISLVSSGGVKYPGSPTAKSDRATCYKGTSCKFLK